MASPASTVTRSNEGGEFAAAGTSPASSARAAADVIAITTRDDFLLELSESLGGQAAVQPYDSMSAALQQLASSRRVQILVIDSRDIADLRGDIALAQAQAPQCVTVIFAQSDHEKSVAGAMKGSNVFAVLPIPIDQRKTAAVVEGAIADVLARRTASRATPAAEAHSPDLRYDRAGAISVEPHAPTATRPAAGGARQNMPVYGGIGLAAVILAGVGLWFVMRSSGTAPPAATVAKGAAPVATSATRATSASMAEVVIQAPVVDTKLLKGSADELLEKARLAMHERRFTEPVGDNALIYFRSAAATDPSNAEALDGLSRLATALAARYEETMTAGHYEDAASALANLTSAAPKDVRLGQFESRLMTAEVNKAFADGSLDRVSALLRLAQTNGSVSADQISKWRGDIARRQDDVKVKHLTDLALERIRDGHLDDPADDSARAYLQQLQTQAPSNPAAQRIAQALGAAYLHKARETGLANHPADTDRWLGEAKAVGVGATEINALQRELAGARTRAATAEGDRLAQLARDRMRDGHLTDPTSDSALYYVGALQAAAADHPAIAPLTHDLTAKLLERATTAARNNNRTQVDSDLAQARRLGADPKDLQAVQLLLVGAAKSAPASSRPNTDLASQLKRTRYTAPEYPDQALDKMISGTVTLEYTVGADGDTHDVHIVSAEPAGVFERSAIAAVKRWRYAPLIVNNVPVEVPVRTIIRFELPK